MPEKNNFKLIYLSHVIIWLLFLIVPIFLLENVGRLVHNLPVYFAVSFLMLIGIYYALYCKFTPQLLLKNKSPQYVGILVIIFLVYRHVPEFICTLLPESDWTNVPNRPSRGFRAYLNPSLKQGNNSATPFRRPHTMALCFHFLPSAIASFLLIPNIQKLASGVQSPLSGTPSPW